MAPPRKDFKVSANPLAFAELCWLLNTGEYSREELLELTGIADSTLRKWLSYLRRSGKQLVRICERRVVANLGAPKLIYTWDPDQKDVPKIPNLGNAVHSAEYRKRKLERKAFHGTSKKSSSDLS